MDTALLDPDDIGARSRGDVFLTVLRHWRLIVVGVVVGAMVGYLGSSVLPKSYTATSDIFLDAAGPFNPLNPGSAVDMQQYVDQQGGVLTTTSVLEAASRAVPGLTPAALAGALKVEPSSDRNMITVSVTMATPARAQQAANAVVDAYQRQMQAGVDASVAQAEQVVGDKAQLQQIKLGAALYGDGISLIEKAQAPTSPSAPQPLRNGLLGAIVGGVVFGAAAMSEERRRRRRSPDRFEPLLDAPLLGRLPEMSDEPSAMSIAAWAPASELGVAVRTVFVALDHLLSGDQRRTVVVAGLRGGYTASAVVANLAVAAHVEARPAVIVDLAGSGGTVTDAQALFAAGHGNLTALSGDLAPVNGPLHHWDVADDVVVPVATLVRPLAAADGQAAQTRFDSLIERLERAHSLVLVDAPPLLEEPEAVGVAGRSGLVVLVVDASTTDEDVEGARRLLERAGASVAGYVATSQRRSARPRGGYPVTRRKERAARLPRALRRMSGSLP